MSCLTAQEVKVVTSIEVGIGYRSSDPIYINKYFESRHIIVYTSGGLTIELRAHQSVKYDSHNLRLFEIRHFRETRGQPVLKQGAVTQECGSLLPGNTV